MSKDSLVILKAFGCFIGASLTCFITFGVAFTDTILFPEDKFSEQGLVENTQTFLLLASAAVYCFIGRQAPNKFYILISGFLVCLMIRELDAFFDTYLFHGSWVYFALAATALFVYSSLRSGYKKVIDDISSSLEKYSFYWLFAGVTVVLIFSRMFGMKVFWENALGPNFHVDMKRLVEETAELWGYFIIMASALVCLIEYKRK